MSLRSLSSGLAAFFLLLFTSALFASDVQMNAVFVCNGERLIVESCNMRDTSDTSTCMVGHPDQIKPNGLMAYTNETRGALKKLLPTCKQPTAEQIAKANNFQRRQAEQMAANTKKANDELDANEAKVQATITGKSAQSDKDREANRCIASGRAQSLCMGNQLGDLFGSAVNMLMPGMVKPPEPGISLSGSYTGKGRWRINFNDDVAQTECGTLSSQPRDYRIDIKNGAAVVTIESDPKPIVLTLKPDGTMVGTGPLTVKGYIITSSGGGGSTTTAGHMESHTTTTTHEYTPMQAAEGTIQQDSTLQRNGQTYTTTSTSTSNTYVPGTTTYSGPKLNYNPKTESCMQPVLASQGVVADNGQDAASKLLFGSKPAAPAPAGLRMRGNYVGADGFSVEFYPESAVVGCGQAARAYPYVVKANGSQAVVKIDDPEHPLLLAIKADGELDPGQGRYEVHGRTITGRQGDNFTFAPLNATCNLVTVAAVVDPASRRKGGSTGFSIDGLATSLVGQVNEADNAAKPKAAASTSGASAARPAAAPTTMASAAPAPNVSAARPAASTPSATAGGGTAVLSISSGLSVQAGAPNPLAGHPYVLLRDSYANVVAKSGVQVPAGTSPYKVMGQACMNHTPDCQKIMDAVKVSAASVTRADANGKGTFPGVAAGTYYLMISTRYNNQPMVWDMPVRLKAGDNALTLDPSNATPLQ